MVQEALRELPGLSYRELLRWKNSIRGSYPKEVYRSALITAGYAKWHVASYPNTKALCMRILHDFSDPEGADRYEEYFLQYARNYDLKVSGQPQEDDFLNHPLTIIKNNSKLSLSGEIRSRDFPSINGFPRFDRKKESKMWLTQLDELTPLQLEIFEKKARNFLRKFSNESFYVPNISACMAIDQNWYSDGHVKRRNCEEPVFSWSDSWDYQTFWTSPTSKREVWLPPKDYKTCSLWWHLFVMPIIEKADELVGNDQLTEVRKSLQQRMRPCRKIDLKGFGLQFPRSLILILMKILGEYFPSLELDLVKKQTENMFNKISVKMPDGKFISPIRGVGLGYFSNLMTIAVRVILDGVYIVKMFNDDILVDDHDYNMALMMLTDLGFVINEKKSGEFYNRAPYFMNVSMDKRGSVHYQDVQGPWAAAVLARHHYQRKSIFLMVPYAHKWKMRYHYERLFGYELHRGEVYDHPTTWGINPHATEYVGYVTGGLLRKFTSERLQDVTEHRVKSTYFPWKTAKESKFHLARFKARRFKRHKWYTGYDEYLHPKMKEAKWINNINFVNQLEPYTVPTWYDLRCILNLGYSTGRFLRGLSPSEARHALSRYCFHRDPIGTMKNGGAIVVTPYHKGPSLSGLNLEIYNALEHVNVIKPQKVETDIPGRVPTQLKREDALYSSIKEMLEETGTEILPNPDIIPEDQIIDILESLVDLNQPEYIHTLEVQDLEDIDYAGGLPAWS